MTSTSCRFVMGLLLAITFGCGGRTALEDGPGSGPEGGGGGAGQGGGGAGVTAYDPDVECPVATCTGTDCSPTVLFEANGVGWFTVDGGDLYYTTDDPDAPNQLVRVPVCGGEPVVLLERTRFAGEGLVVGDALYIPVEEPAREVLRLPKTGGAPEVVYSHDGSDPYTTRAISEHAGYLLLSLYSFDGGLVLRELTPEGNTHQLNENLPDADWAVTYPAGSLFVPNKPTFVAPGEYPYRALIHSDIGIHQVLPYLADDPFTWGIEPISVEHPAVGQVLTSDPNDPDAVLFFSTEDDIETEVHFKLEGETLTPILPDTGGVLVALDGDQLYGTSNYFYYDEFGNIDSRGDLWRAVESGVGVEGLLTTNGQNVFQLEVHGQSLYVRTTRALLRLPKSCQTADDTCRFTFGS